MPGKLREASVHGRNQAAEGIARSKLLYLSGASTLCGQREMVRPRFSSITRLLRMVTESNNCPSKMTLSVLTQTKQGSLVKQTCLINKTGDLLGSIQFLVQPQAL